MEEARFTMRIHPIIMNKMKHIAKNNGRSLNKEIEQILKWVIEDYERKYGQLLTPDIRIHRQYFREMVKLLGIQSMYRSPLSEGTYTLHGEYTSINYSEPIRVGVIFQEHEDQKTAKKLG